MVLDSRGGNRPPTHPPCTSGDHVETFERWAGGVANLHSVLWMRGPPRIGLATGDEKSREGRQNSDMLLAPEFADDVVGYFENYIEEVHALKPEAGEEK